MGSSGRREPNDLTWATAACAPVTRHHLLCGPVTYLEASVDGYEFHRLAALDRPHPARPAPDPGEIMLGAAHHLFWSLSFAVDSSTWARVGGFHEGYVGYGGEDTDFAWAARARGVPMAWVGGARAYHQHHAVDDPPTRHLDAILRNATLFRRRWGEWPMRGWFDAFVAQGLLVRTPSGGYEKTPRSQCSQGIAGRFTCR